MSSVINSGAERNFNDYINGLRIESVKAELRALAGKKVNLLAVGLEAGFSSKTNFNTSFKQFTGCTPSQFLKELKGQAQHNI